MRRDAEWETRIQVADCSWKQIAEPVMRLYTETTDGSTIEDRETALVWSYEDADFDFGSCQAKELLDHLESVLANEPVSVKSGPHIVEVKPQVHSLSFPPPHTQPKQLGCWYQIEVCTSSAAVFLADSKQQFILVSGTSVRESLVSRREIEAAMDAY